MPGDPGLADLPDELVAVAARWDLEESATTVTFTNETPISGVLSIDDLRAVPEPAGAVALGACVTWLGVLARRRRSRQ